MNLKEITKHFQKDLTDYQPIPFWSWNDRLDPEKVKKQIRWMKDNQIGGFFMHARGGLKTEYLSEEWMRAIEAGCDEAEKLGMNAWAYDENGWPSGFAGGKLLEDEENRDCYLLHKIGAADREAQVCYEISGDCLVRVAPEDAAGENILNLYIKRATSTADILNPQVVEKFVQLTHEAYKERLGGEDLSRRIRGFFTDEPQYQRWNTPFTTVLFDYYQKNFGEDILDGLGLLFVEKKGYRAFRYRYWKSLQHLMLHSFAKKVYDWCEENGVSLTGHYIEEKTLTGQMLCCAGIMPFYAYMHVPGIDWLGKKTENEIPARQLASVAAQMGKKQTLTETFACCGWEISPRELKALADFQCVGGASLICHHLVPYSEYGQRKKDYPSHFSPVNPWVEKEFSDFNRYFTRLGYLLSNSEETVSVAVLHPIRSTYLDYKRHENGSIADWDERFLKDCRALSKKGISYHFLDETLLSENGFVEKGRIGCGACSYDYLVLPHILATDRSTEKLLRRYVESGGKVLCLGDPPRYCEGEDFDYSYLSSNYSLEELAEAQEFSVKNKDSEIYQSFRSFEGRSLLIVQNDSADAVQSQTYDFGEGVCSFRQLDLFTLEEKSVPLTVTLEPGETKVLFLDSTVAPEEKKKKEIVFSLNDAGVSFEKNLLTVDDVRYSTDGVNFSKLYPVPGLFAKLLQERYEGEIYFRYDFTVKEIPKRIRLSAECVKGRACRLNGHLLSSWEESEKDEALATADVTPFIRLGINEFTVKMHWFQKEGVYYALFGENVTESLRNCLVYDTELEPIYLSGEFGVYSEKPFSPGKNEPYVYGDSFYIGKVPQRVTEPVTEGFPFFAGELTVSQTLFLEETDAVLVLPGTWHVAYVRINGKSAGKLVYGRKIDLSLGAKKGENRLEITFVIGNRNLLGPHHNRERENMAVNPTSFTIRDPWTDGENPYYADRYNLILLNCKESTLEKK